MEEVVGETVVIRMRVPVVMVLVTMMMVMTL